MVIVVLLVVVTMFLINKYILMAATTKQVDMDCKSFQIWSYRHCAAITSKYTLFKLVPLSIGHRLFAACLKLVLLFLRCLC